MGINEVIDRIKLVGITGLTHKELICIIESGENVSHNGVLVNIKHYKDAARFEIGWRHNERMQQYTRNLFWATLGIAVVTLALVVVNFFMVFR